MIFDDLAFFGLSYAALLIAAFAYSVHLLRSDRFFGRVGVGASIAAAITLLAGLSWRVAQAGESYLLTGADFLCLALAFVTIVNQLIIEQFTKGRKGGSGPGLIALLLESVALFIIPAVRPRVVPAPAPLGEPWFTLHTVIILWAYGLLAVAAGYGLAALWPVAPQELQEGQGLSMALGGIVLWLGLTVGGWWAWSTSGFYLPASASIAWGLIVWLICAGILGRNSSPTTISRKVLFLPVLAFVLVAVALGTMASG